jgi:hypothetical protein
MPPYKCNSFLIAPAKNTTSNGDIPADLAARTGAACTTEIAAVSGILRYSQKALTPQETKDTFARLDKLIRLFDIIVLRFSIIPFLFVITEGFPLFLSCLHC